MREFKTVIFFGKMGAWKTTAAANEILEANKRGMNVWCNFPLLDWEKRNKDAPCYFCDDLLDVSSMENGLFVYDEAYRGLNARKWQNFDERIHAAFMHTRKRHLNVIIIAQSWKRIDVSVREVAKFARLFDGATWGKFFLPYQDFPIDEAGDIIKPTEIRVEPAKTGNYFNPKKAFGIFDTDFMFEKAEQKNWPNAINYVLPPKPEMAH